MSFWVWYDYMGTWFVINLCLLVPWIIFIAPFFSRVGDVSFLSAFLLLFSCLYFYFTNTFVSAFVVAILNRKEGLRKKLGFALKVGISKSVPVGFLFSLLFFLFLFNVWFYMNVRFVESVLIVYVLTGFFVWLVLFTFSALLWSIPALSFKKLGIFRYVVWGYVLLFANPYFSFQMFFCYTLLCLLNIFPLFFFFVGMVIPPIFLTCTYEILSRKYESLKNKEAGLPEYIIFRDYEDEFLNRGWEHLYKPWKM